MARVLRAVLAPLVLGLVLVAVPDSGVRPADTALVKVRSAQGVDLSPDVVWILALGSDARLGEPVLRSRADAIQLVGINTRTGAASAIGIARDSWVSIPGHGSNRINAAMYFGGPQLMAEAVRGLVGIEPDYVFTASFHGLAKMVKAVGGVTVDSRYAFSDPYLRPKGYSRGANKLNGFGAVWFARIRKSLPGGDFDRSANQQELIRAIHAKVRANGDRPGFLEKGTFAVLRNMDANVAPQELYRIAQAMTMVQPGKLKGCVVRGSFGNVNGASIVFPDRAQARRYGAAARRDATLGRC
jgi:LCP family protein required for cell wall assembly